MSVSKTRQLLISVARELFAEKGMDGTTMNDIAEASQRGRRTLYTYFRNKEEIYSAVIASELEIMSERLDQVALCDEEPDKKIINLIYAHLEQIKETVARNGSIHAEFFNNMAQVEKVRRTIDMEELNVLRRIITQGCNLSIWRVSNIDFIAEIIQYAIKGMEVPYILGHIGEGMDEKGIKEEVCTLIFRALGKKDDDNNSSNPPQYKPIVI